MTYAIEQPNGKLVTKPDGEVLTFVYEDAAKIKNKRLDVDGKVVEFKYLTRSE